MVTITSGTPIVVIEEIEEPISGANAVGEAPSTAAEVPGEQQESLWDMVVAARSSLSSRNNSFSCCWSLQMNPNDLG